MELSIGVDLQGAQAGDGGGGVVDHPPGAHDDGANAAVGAMVLAAQSGAVAEGTVTSMKPRRRLGGSGFDAPLAFQDMPR